MATKKVENTPVVIPAIEIKSAIIKVVGDSPLIMHAWSDKAKQMILDKQMKKAKAKGHDAKCPVEDFVNSMYWLKGKPTEYTEEAFAAAIESGARFGFPSTAFKASAVAAAYRAGVMKNMVTANGSFHIDGEFVEIKGVPHMREDMVRIAMGGTDIRFRGQFDEWSATFTVKFNSGVLSLEQLVNMFNLGGFACGLGEWRAEKGGTFGMYHIE
jgi:hypothetical protein